jgi:DNA modification methylase
MNNTFYHGDCLFVMNHDIEPNSVDLIYLDPPFFTGKAQKGTAKWQPGAMEVSYEDSKHFWKEKGISTNAPEWLKHIALQRPDFAAYLFYMMERLKACHKVLKDTGSIYLHCDEKASHYLKMIMDEIFGYCNYRNEIIWNYGGRGGKATANKYAKNHDVIIFYSKSPHYTFNRQYITRRYSPDEARSKGFRKDELGWFKTAPRGNYTDDSIAQLRQDNRIYETETGSIRIRYPLKIADGMVTEDIFVGDTWSDIADAMHIGNESVGYPTQKPLSLLERILKVSSNEGDAVLDPFCGCGTAIIEAQKLNRQWIGIDISKDAYEVSTVRHGELPLNFTHFNYVIRDLEEVLAMTNATEFEKWVNTYFKATKPMPDKGVDGITQDGTPIQTKAFQIKYPQVSEFSTNFRHHPKVSQPVKRAIMVSQKGFDESARTRQYEISDTDGINIEFYTPEQLLNVNPNLLRNLRN